MKALATAIALVVGPGVAAAEVPEVPESGFGLLAGFDDGGLHAGALLKPTEALSLDASAGFLLIVAVLESTTPAESDIEVIGSFSASARVRYLPIVTATGRGRIGASLAYHYNSVLDHGASVGPEAEIALRDDLSVRVGLTLTIYPEGEENTLAELDRPPDTQLNFPFGGDVDLRGAVGLIWYP